MESSSCGFTHLSIPLKFEIYFRLVFRIDRLGTKESIDTFIDFFVHDALEKTLRDNLKRFNYFVDLYSNYIRNVSITSKVLERLE